jgi:chemotaxis protein methyltransferase CheR
MHSPDEADSIELGLVLDAIHRRYGYDLREYVPETIERRLRGALARSGMNHFGELQHRLLHDAEWFASLLDQLTVQVSGMFRDPPFYRMFRERVVPLLKTYPELKIWHAGCASGEEVYATAIVLLEENLYERTQIYATDLSATALEAAKLGVYRHAQAVEFTENYRAAGGTRCFEDYYAAGYDRIVMRETLKQNVVFFQHNLASDYAIGEMNVIFCRNVLFYFDKPLRQRVLGMFAESLRRGGFLCFGASEAAPADPAGAFTGFVPQQRIFRRSGDA